MEKEHELIKTVFSNTQGKKLLALWDTVYMDRPSYEPGRPVEECVYFEGQRSFLLSIKQLLEMKDG